MIGTRLAHYEITKHLGTGGMGEVYQARNQFLAIESATSGLSMVIAPHWRTELRRVTSRQ